MFDVEGARKAGYSDAEIADHIGGKKFDVAGARKAGYSDSDIVSHLLKAPSESKPANGMLERAWERGKQSPEAALLMGLGKGVGEVGLGAQHYVGKGLSAIGAETAGNWLVNDAAQGRQKLSGEIADYKAREPIATGLGEVAGNVAATAPVGGLLAMPLRSVAPKLASSIATSGMATGAAPVGMAAKAGDIGLRMLGGGITGGASAAMVDPESAGAGAAIGAATPGFVKAAGAAGTTLAALVRPFFASGQQRIVGDLLRQHVDDPAAAVAALMRASEVVPGSKPLTAAAAGDVGLSGLTRTMQNASPDFANEIANRTTAQNAARTTAIENIAGNPGKLAVAKEARDAATAPMREAVLARARGVDSAGLSSSLDGMLRDPNNAGDLAQQVLSKYAKQIAKHTQGGQINARALYEIRKDINQDLAGKLQGEAGNLRYASGQLVGVKTLIDDAIEAASRRPAGAAPSSSRELVPRRDVTDVAMSAGAAVGPRSRTAAESAMPEPATGWRDYLSTYAEASRPIERMETLQDTLRRVQNGTTDTAGNLMLSPAKLNTLLKNESAELAKILTPEELQVLRNVAGDMNAGQLALTAGKSVGSNTVQNLSQDGLLRSALGKLGASPLMTTTLGNLLRIPYGRANQQIQQRLGDALADPAIALSAFRSGAPRQGGGVPLSSLIYRTSPLLGAQALDE